MAVNEILIALPVPGLASWGLWRAVRGYWKFRGTRVVACPESGQFAAVELAARRIAAAAVLRQPTLVLRDCSRWREGMLCGQPCVRRIAEDPAACRVSTILAEWYREKNCICCGRPVGKPARWSHSPCLMSPDLLFLQCKAIPAGDIPLALTTHAPVCWTCMVAETHTW